jgi:putative ATPase
LSRVKVYILEALGEQQLLGILERALADPDRGLGGSGVTATQASLAMVARLAAGDARQALNHLELAVSVAAADDVDAVDESLVRRVAQRSVALYDKGREEHFNLISALHKSVRNSDVDASLYWLGRMLEGGADPRFVVRRMLRMASEDIGMADPRALEQVAAAALAVEHVGMPECELALAQAAVYLALAPKSNALYTGYGAVKREVSERPGLAVPMAIRNAPTALMEEAGYGAGYRYAHDEASGVANLRCLPDELARTRFYRPTDRGWEQRIRDRMREIDALKKRPR